MKNIHVLPKNSFQNIKLSLFENKLYLGDIASTALPQQIYITNDEEIKEGDWYFNTTLNIIQKSTDKDYLKGFYENYKKIILTTDQDLIKDGVQAIPDEFLEWFVKNPSCEYVEIENIYDKFLNGDKRSVSDFRNKYKIIIPKEDLSYTTKSGVNILDEFVRTFMIPKEYFGKEEPKQETLEEVAERLTKDFPHYSVRGNMDDSDIKGWFLEALQKGAKWQAKRMYSKEESIQKIIDYVDFQFNTKGELNLEIKKWFEQFKKK